MSSATKIAIVLFALIAVASASFIAGLKVETWRNGAADAATLKENLAQENDSIKDMASNYTALSGKVDTLNAATQHGTLLTLDKIGDQTHAIQNLRLKLATVSVGTCTLNADADQLLQNVYQAVNPAGSGSAAAPAVQAH